MRSCCSKYFVISPTVTPGSTTTVLVFSSSMHCKSFIFTFLNWVLSCTRTLCDFFGSRLVTNFSPDVDPVFTAFITLETLFSWSAAFGLYHQRLKRNVNVTRKESGRTNSKTIYGLRKFSILSLVSIWTLSPAYWFRPLLFSDFRFGEEGVFFLFLIFLARIQ